MAAAKGNISTPHLYARPWLISLKFTALKVTVYTIAFAKEDIVRLHKAHINFTLN